MTIHVGEEGGDIGREEIGEVVEALRPDRIGHGILAAGDPELMAALRDAGIVLEICPTSNLLTKALPNEEAVRDTFRAFVDHGVRVHDRDGRAGDDADAPAGRARAAASHRRAGRGRARAGESPGPRFELCARHAGFPEGVVRRNTPFGQWSGGAWPNRFVPMYDALRESLPNITERQRQVIELIAAGCSNDEVGERLGISPRTAKAHSDVLRQKLGVTRRRQIPVAYRAITGDDPLARSLESAAADSGG